MLKWTGTDYGVVYSYLDRNEQTYTVDELFPDLTRARDYFKQCQTNNSIKTAQLVIGGVVVDEYSQ